MPSRNLDPCYVGAPDVAEAFFGNRDRRNVRRVYHWNTLKGSKRPPFLLQIGNRPACFESAIAAFKAGTTDTAAE
jgi:hypothetical protein